MATSQFYSVCLAHETIRACRAFLLASPCSFSRSFLHTRAMSGPQLSFKCSPTYGLNYRSGPSPFASRALSSMGPSSRNRKPALTSQNPREEIRRLDEEIHRLERERRSVGKPKKGTSHAGGKSLHGGKKGNAGHGSDVASKATYAKPSPVGRSAKFAASAGSSRSANARALARYEQEDAEEEEEEDDDDLEEDEDDKDDDVIDKELGEDFSSDAEMYMETSDEEESPKDETSRLASSASKKQDAELTEIFEDRQPGNEVPVNEASTVDNVDREGGPIIKHPWKEWNDFYDVLSQKNYFKDVPTNNSAMEGEGYLRFQASAHMKRAILEFSRERDDIIRFLTKKHIKAVVMVGCPSTDRKVVNACKRLRVVCEIPEDEVCQQCKLKTFCTRAFAAPSPDLMAETVDVARVLYSFALNASPIAESQVSYPVSAVKSACHLVNEIVQLSAYPKDPGLPALKSRLPVKPPVSEKRDTDDNHRPGDWSCPDCKFVNFAKNRQCRECGTFKGSEKPLEPGDWECPECTFVNFRRNKECRECSTARPMDAGGGESLKPGEWICPECQFVNFRRNSECYKCSTSRPRGIKLYDDEELEPGDWLCPECNFKNFKRNKSCKECGALSLEQNKRDDRWGLRKSAGGGWGSNRSLPSVSAEGGGSSGRSRYQEWKPDLSRKMSDESDEDLEENADVVFGLGEDEDGEGSLRASRVSVKKSKTKGGVSQCKDIDEGLPSDFDLSDLDDLPQSSSKKLGRKSKAGKGVIDDEDEDEDEDDDTKMVDELSEDERSMSNGSSKQARGISERWDDTGSDDDDNPPTARGISERWDDTGSDDDDNPPTAKAVIKHNHAKNRGLSSNLDDSDDEEGDLLSDDDEEDFGARKCRSASAQGSGNFGSKVCQRAGRFGSPRGARDDEEEDGFSDDDDNEEDDFGGHKGRNSFTRGAGKFDSKVGQRGGRFGSSRGGREDYGSSRGGRGGYGNSKVHRDGRFGSSRGERGESYGRGGRGRRSSNFSESSDDDGDFRSGWGDGGRRGSAAGGNGRARGGRGSGGFRGRGGRGRGRGRGGRGRS